MKEKRIVRKEELGKMGYGRGMRWVAGGGYKLAKTCSCSARHSTGGLWVTALWESNAAMHVSISLLADLLEPGSRDSAWLLTWTAQHQDAHIHMWIYISMHKRKKWGGGGEKRTEMKKKRKEKKKKRRKESNWKKVKKGKGKKINKMEK